MGALALLLGLLSCGFLAATLAVGRRQLRALVSVGAAPLREPLLVVMPARNEGARLRPTLQALLASEPSTALSVIVVDDRSTDDTAAVAGSLGDARVRVLTLESDPPAGIFGKPRALQAGLDDARARGALPARVLFLDADVVLAEGAPGGLVAAAQVTHADALSGVPHLVCASAVEALFVPALVSLVTSGAPPARVHDDDDPAAFLNGQLILVRTEALDAVGGLGAVSGTVLEDVALAKLLKQHHRKLRLGDLRTLASTRMYESFHALDEGFGKNAVALVGGKAGALGVFAFVTSLLQPAAAILGLVDGTALGLAACACAALGLVLQWSARTMAGAPRWPILVLPLVYAGVAFVLVKASIRAALKRPVRWRGREYPS